MNKTPFFFVINWMFPLVKFPCYCCGKDIWFAFAWRVFKAPEMKTLGIVCRSCAKTNQEAASKFTEKFQENIKWNTLK